MSERSVYQEKQCQSTDALSNGDSMAFQSSQVKWIDTETVAIKALSFNEHVLF